MTTTDRAGSDGAPTGAFGTGRATGVDAALRSMRAMAADGGDLVPGAPGTADPEVLRTALATLPYGDQRLLWDRYVLDRGLDTIALSLGSHSRSVGRHLRAAEQRLARALAAAHARTCPPGCVDTRTALHDYARRRLSPHRRSVLEEHLFGCEGCMRAFIDVREATWAVRDAGPLVLAGAVGAGAAPMVVGAMPAAVTGAAGFAGLGPAGAVVAGGWEWLAGQARRLTQVVQAAPAAVVAGVTTVVAAVVVAGVLLGGGDPTGAVAARGPGSAPVVAPPSGPSAEPAVPSASPSASASVPPPAEDEPAGRRSAAPSPSPAPSPAPTAAPPADDAAPVERPAPAPTRTEAPVVSPSAPVTPSPKPSPVAPKPSATPSPKPTPSTPAPTPDTVEHTVTLTVPASRLPRLYRVDVEGQGAVITRVTTPDRWVSVVDRRHGRHRWSVCSGGHRPGTVDATVTAPSGVEPRVRLQELGRGCDRPHGAPDRRPEVTRP